MNAADRDVALPILDRLMRWIEDPEDLDHEYAVNADDDPPTPPPVQALMDATILTEFLEKHVPTFVLQARDAGETWQDIGETMGISRQAAWERFK